jgi:hypothetical protein
MNNNQNLESSQLSQPLAAQKSRSIVSESVEIIMPTAVDSSVIFNVPLSTLFPEETEKRDHHLTQQLGSLAATSSWIMPSSSYVQRTTNTQISTSTLGLKRDGIVRCWNRLPTTTEEEQTIMELNHNDNDIAEIQEYQHPLDDSILASINDFPPTQPQRQDSLEQKELIDII